MKKLLTLVWVLSSPLFGQMTNTLRNSLVTVIVHKQDVDVHEPWRSGRVYTEEHVGSVVSFDNNNEKGILVKASALAFAKRIEMQLVSGTELVELSPRFVDYEINLALLQPTEPDLLESLHALMISDRELPSEEEVALYKIENGTHVVRYHSLLRDVNYGERTDTSSYPTINYVFKLPLKELGWSEPILSRGALVALAVGQDDEDNVHAIPGSIVSHFLNDSLNDKYEGFPTMGIKILDLSSPNMRVALGIENNQKGALIASVRKNSSFADKISAGDVLLAIEGNAINAKGNYIHPIWGEKFAGACLYKYYAGDTITIDVIKDHKRQKFSGRLQRYNSNLQTIPYYAFDTKPVYRIVGGLVFQELTRPYLRSWGRDWEGDAPSALAHLWRIQNEIPSHLKDRIIILNQVLADEANKGYEGIANAVVQFVNNQEIHSFNDFERALTKPALKNGEAFVRIKLDYGEGEVILAMKDLAKANERIADNYGVYEKSVFFNPPPPEARPSETVQSEEGSNLK